MKPIKLASFISLCACFSLIAEEGALELHDETAALSPYFSKEIELSIPKKENHLDSPMLVKSIQENPQSFFAHTSVFEGQSSAEYTPLLEQSEKAQIVIQKEYPTLTPSQITHEDVQLVFGVNLDTQFDKSPKIRIGLPTDYQKAFSYEAVIRSHAHSLSLKAIKSVDTPRDPFFQTHSQLTMQFTISSIENMASPSFITFNSLRRGGLARVNDRSIFVSKLLSSCQSILKISHYDRSKLDLDAEVQLKKVIKFDDVQKPYKRIFDPTFEWDPFQLEITAKDLHSLKRSDEPSEKGSFIQYTDLLDHSFTCPLATASFVKKKIQLDVLHPTVILSVVGKKTDLTLKPKYEIAYAPREVKAVEEKFFRHIDWYATNFDLSDSPKTDLLASHFSLTDIGDRKDVYLEVERSAPATNLAANSQLNFSSKSFSIRPEFAKPFMPTHFFAVSFEAAQIYEPLSMIDEVTFLPGLTFDKTFLQETFTLSKIDLFVNVECNATIVASSPYFSSNISPMNRVYLHPLRNYPPLVKTTYPVLATRDIDPMAPLPLTPYHLETPFYPYLFAFDLDEEERYDLREALVTSKIPSKANDPLFSRVALLDSYQIGVSIDTVPEKLVQAAHSPRESIISNIYLASLSPYTQIPDEGSIPDMPYSEEELLQDMMHFAELSIKTRKIPKREFPEKINREHRFTRENLILLGPDDPDIDDLSSHFASHIEVAKRPDETGYLFSLTLTPKQTLMAEPLGQHFTFLVDRSSSIERHRFSSFRAAISRSLKELKPHDRFNIVFFDSKIDRFSKEPVASTTSNIRKAHDFLAEKGKQGLISSSDSLKLLSSLKREISETSDMHTVILLTNGDSMTTLARKKQRLAKLFADTERSKLSIYAAAASSGNNLGMMELVSRGIHGQLLYSPTNAAFPRKVAALVRKLSTPLAHSIQVNPTIPREEQNLEFYGMENQTALYLDKPLTIYGSARDLENFDLLIQGKSDDGWLNIKTRVSMQNAKQGGKELQREYAMHKAQTLLREYIKADNTRSLKAADEYFTAFNIPTP